MSKKISLFQLLLPISSDWETMFLSGAADIPILKAKNHTNITPRNQKIICHTHIDGIQKAQLSTLFGFPNMLFPIIKPGPNEKNIQVIVTIHALGLRLLRLIEKFL